MVMTVAYGCITGVASLVVALMMMVVVAVVSEGEMSRVAARLGRGKSSKHKASDLSPRKVETGNCSLACRSQLMPSSPPAVKSALYFPRCSARNPVFLAIISYFAFAFLRLHFIFLSFLLGAGREKCLLRLHRDVHHGTERCWCFRIVLRVRKASAKGDHEWNFLQTMMEGISC